MGQFQSQCMAGGWAKGNTAMQKTAVYNVNEQVKTTADIFQGTEHEIQKYTGKNLPRARKTAKRDDAAQASSAPVLAVRQAKETPGLYLVNTQLVIVAERALPYQSANLYRLHRKAFKDWHGIRTRNGYGNAGLG